jgi:hypothetical protein
MAKSKPADVRLGKFDILATYTYAKALLDGLPEDDAKQRGLVAAIMGAHARMGIRHGKGEDDFEGRKQAAEKKKKTSITAEAFDHQIEEKLGGFFGKVFLPAMKKLVRAGLSYEEVKEAVGIPGRWGSKISGEQFRERASGALKETKGG